MCARAFRTHTIISQEREREKREGQKREQIKENRGKGCIRIHHRVDEAQRYMVVVWMHAQYIPYDARQYHMMSGMYGSGVDACAIHTKGRV